MSNKGTKLEVADFDDDELLRGDFDDATFLNQGVDDIDADTTLTEGEKAVCRAERLERNREIARNCRKRKRERIELLMDEVSSLREVSVCVLLSFVTFFVVKRDTDPGI